MTYLSFRAEEEAIYIAMDTLATSPSDTGLRGFMEKAFYLKGPNAIITIKGSLNILAPFIIKVLDKQHKFSTAKELEKYTERHLNRHLKERIEKMPEVEGIMSTVRIFSWQKNKPVYFKAEYWSTPQFIFIKTRLKPGDTHYTNDVSLETSQYNDFISQNIDALRSEMNYIHSVYGKRSFEESVFFTSIASMVNDPPETYSGGKIFVYKLGKSKPKFDKKLLFALSSEASPRMSIKDANRLFNR